MAEPRETRLKRMRMRSMRRGTKEMDILMMRFAEAHLDAMDEAELDLLDRVLEENDQDLYRWITGQDGAPGDLAPLIARIAAEAERGPAA
ncbi:succinate dehydrogenase assembly factor 2 [Pseudooceanicola onchidii]|uniref:succinate dehydrogenase assembly factor 2 n=1 Tax=Pseudooceanicola onchidii TaxID=2562279 RepID=UPI0010AA9B4D|nr:succinate dehydrogenase assembly factor 2 [Pseudooceanicola onchidii]